jgi:hypothetical protein
MKQLGLLVPILLLLGVGITGGPAAAELTANQQVQPSTAAVGEMATVMLMLSYNGNDATQVTVTPGFVPGIVADSGTQTAELYPGSQQMISYPIRAERSGFYSIISIINYADDGVMRRQLNMVSPFSATGEPGGQPATGAPALVLPGPIVSPGPGGNESMPSEPVPELLPIKPAQSTNMSA